MDHTTAHALMVLAGVAVSMLGAHTTVVFTAWTVDQLDERALTTNEVASAAVLWPCVLVQMVGLWVFGICLAVLAALFDGDPPDDGGNAC